jgi:hypothetical protein
VGAEQEALEAFDEFIALRQMGPARLDVEQVGLHGGVAHLLGAPTAIGGALQAIRNVVGQLLEHRASCCSIYNSLEHFYCNVKYSFKVPGILTSSLLVDYLSVFDNCWTLMLSAALTDMPVSMRCEASTQKAKFM